MITEYEYFICVDIKNGTPVLLYTSKDGSYIEDRYNRIKREKEYFNVEGVKKEDVLAVSLCVAKYYYGRQVSTECLRRVAL